MAKKGRGTWSAGDGLRALYAVGLGWHENRRHFGDALSWLYRLGANARTGEEADAESTAEWLRAAAEDLGHAAGGLEALADTIGEAEPEDPADPRRSALARDVALAVRGQVDRLHEELVRPAPAEGEAEAEDASPCDAKTYLEGRDGGPVSAVFRESFLAMLPTRWARSLRGVGEMAEELARCAGRLASLDPLHRLAGAAADLRFVREEIVQQLDDQSIPGLRHPAAGWIEGLARTIREIEGIPGVERSELPEESSVFRCSFLVALPEATAGELRSAAKRCFYVILDPGWGVRGTAGEHYLALADDVDQAAGVLAGTPRAPDARGLRRLAREMRAMVAEEPQEDG